MAIPYPFTSSQATHISTGSYLDQKETSMFVSGYVADVWYGFSETDVIEVSVFDLDQNQLGWDTIHTEKNYKTTTLTYLDSLDRPTEYSFRELQSDFLLYKNSKILVNPIEDLSSSFGIVQGSYILTYNFIREMAGNPSEPLVVKEISPSRKEIKLVPAGNNTLRYHAFCQKKFQVKDVAPLLLQLTNQCPYSQIYARVKDKYQQEISFLKQLLFLESDGEFITFLKSLYEDIVVYTTPPSTSDTIDRVKRTQGIKNYFHNYLQTNYETISDFFQIDSAYDTFSSARVEQQFKPYGIQLGKSFVDAKKFLVNFFTEEFYHLITLSTKEAFDQKYYSYFKNALNLGNNQMFIIIDHAFIDERSTPTDPLTLLIKLKSELPEEVKTQAVCWVSNISIAPFVVNAILRNPRGGKTITIGPPNLTLESEHVSLYNVNETYTAGSLRNSVSNQQNIDVSKKISEIPVDYTDFSKFAIFSSVHQRLANFKKKISTWYTVSSSLVGLNYVASQSLVSGTLYPQYGLERGSLESQMADIVNSFDGYEAYLFRTGSYAYDPATTSFVSTSYVLNQDVEAENYDKSNVDSLVNNTPDHIVLDENNDDYLTFLNMVGHFFDNIYLFINNLPSEKVVSNDPTNTLSKKMIDYMLDTFGWKTGTTYEDLSTVDAYTTSISSSMSAEDRTKAIRTRLLNTLPQIYKTKGTEESVKLILSCYGIPSDLLNIREYGNDDYTTSSLVTYTKRERSAMYCFSGSGADFFGPEISTTFRPKPYVRTCEFKMAIDHGNNYIPYQKYTFTNYYHYYLGLYGVYLNSVVSLPSWQIGFFREYGNMGRIFAFLPAWSSSLSDISGRISYNTEGVVYLTSSLLPLFDGEIFNVRLRRNTDDSSYQYISSSQNIPATYDLTVQRNEEGRKIFRSSDVKTCYYPTNMIWDGYSINDVIGTTGSLASTTTSSLSIGPGFNYPGIVRFGNFMIWDVPISDDDFEIHCNDYSSFAYNGSEAEKHLILRLDEDEPYNFSPNSYVYDYYYPDTDTHVYFGFGGSNRIVNKSEYYSTFYDIYENVVASGSWLGAKTGSLFSVENFTGSLKGIVSGSISGSGQGWFVSRSLMTGNFSGSMTGSFNGTSIGNINSVQAVVVQGAFGSGIWDGTLVDVLSQSVFTGSFYGIASGSFFGPSFLNGGPFTGSLFGGFTGSVRTHYMSGTFNGWTSGSNLTTTHTVSSQGTFTGTLTKIWYGSLSGSHTGSFSGSTGYTSWSGNTFWSEFNGGAYSNGQAYFSGSMLGQTSASNFNGSNWLTTYASGMFSGSFIQVWTGSQHILYNKSVMPVEVVFFPSENYYPLNPVVLQSTNFCDVVTLSVIGSQYPYEFSVENFDKTYTTPNYGPNRFRNQKVKPKYQSIASRLDDKSRSTFDQVRNVHSDSNLVGLYLDPQDVKNRDIVKFFGNNDVIGQIADPSNMFSASYTNLKELNDQYNSFGNRQVLYNELITLYKLYFNRSVFDTIKNVIPARSSVRTGILVEPTVLERPKYQHRPVFSEMDTGSVAYFDVTLSHYPKDKITKLVRFSGSVGNTSDGHLGVLFAEFNWDSSYPQTSFRTDSLPANPTINLDVSYINEANYIYPVNYGGGYITDLSDNVQLGKFSTLGDELNPQGVTTMDGNNFTFMVKKWDKYTIYSKSGSYVRNSNKSEDVYLSNSIWLYSLVEMTAAGYSTYFYTSSKFEPSGSPMVLTDLSNLSIIGGYPYYFHRINTAKNTPNEKITGVRAYQDHISYAYVVSSGSFVVAENTYFETFRGYPRNHYTHKRMQYSPVKFLSLSGKYTVQRSTIYVRSRQTVDTTIDAMSGLEDASLPVQSIETSNVNLQQSDNVINQ